jgi:hypothetical protein
MKHFYHLLEKILVKSLILEPINYYLNKNQILIGLNKNNKEDIFVHN